MWKSPLRFPVDWNLYTKLALYSLPRHTLQPWWQSRPPGPQTWRHSPGGTARLWTNVPRSWSFASHGPFHGAEAARKSSAQSPLQNTKCDDKKLKLIQSINQSIESINPSINQSSDQSINQAINRSINPSIKWSIDQSIHQSSDQSSDQSINQSIHRTINQSIKRSINRSNAKLEKPKKNRRKSLLNVQSFCTCSTKPAEVGNTIELMTTLPWQSGSGTATPCCSWLTAPIRRFISVWQASRFLAIRRKENQLEKTQNSAKDKKSTQINRKILKKTWKNLERKSWKKILKKIFENFFVPRFLYDHNYFRFCRF